MQALVPGMDKCLNVSSEYKDLYSLLLHSHEHIKGRIKLLESEHLLCNF